MQTFQPLVLAAEQLLRLQPHQVRRTGWRVDGGFGADANINWLLARDYQGVLKGYNATRASAAARRMAPEAWLTLRPDRWVAVVPDGVRYARRTQSLVLRWLDLNQQPRHALLIHTLLDWEPVDVVHHYDARGQLEVEIGQDKLGLLLTRRRKRHWNAQAAWVILTDLAHNLLRWTRDWMWAGSPFAAYGAKRLTQDVLTAPGQLSFEGDLLRQVTLSATHPLAHEIALCLTRLLTELH